MLMSSEQLHGYVPLSVSIVGSVGGGRCEPKGQPVQALVASGGNAYGLSRRQMAVLRLVADGMSNQQIADALHISRFTVHAHMGCVLKKMHVQNRIQAVSKMLGRY